MSTTITPPPPAAPTGGEPPRPPAPGAPGSGGREPRASSRVIAILAICFGAVLILGTVATGVFATLRTVAISTDTLTADATGITALDIDVAAADFRVAYGDGDASLEVTGGSGAADWRLVRDGDTLEVRSVRPWWGGWNWFGGEERAVLTLPERYADTTLDASFELGAGAIRAEGTYGVLDLQLGAGAIDVAGSAEEVDADISAGRATIDLDGVRTATLQVSAGSLNGELAGTLTDLDLDVSAGRISLTVPDQTYAISEDRSAGSFTHNLETSSTSGNRITATVSAGSIDLRAAR